MCVRRCIAFTYREKFSRNAGSSSLKKLIDRQAWMVLKNSWLHLNVIPRPKKSFQFLPIFSSPQKLSRTWINFCPGYFLYVGQKLTDYIFLTVAQFMTPYQFFIL